jgi:hypothetical protein
MTRLGIVLSALLVVSACRIRTPPLPTPYAPVRARAGAPPRRVIREAAEQLRTEGFLVIAIDSAAHLRAERELRPGQFEGALTCRTADTPASRASVAPTLIIDLAVQPRGDGGTEVVVASRVIAAYLRLTAEPARRRSDQDCSSTGAVERRLVQSLSARM